METKKCPLKSTKLFKYVWRRKMLSQLQLLFFEIGKYKIIHSVSIVM